MNSRDMDESTKVMHLLLRSGFGCSWNVWDQVRHDSAHSLVQNIFDDAQKAEPLDKKSPTEIRESLIGMRNISDADRVKRRMEERLLVNQVRNEWFTRMADPDQSGLLEKMTLFWHGHFACRIQSEVLALNYLDTLRSHALGSFRDLVHCISRDAAMIRYLDNQQNRKDSPNENFARELMELFTIGRGFYSEFDVKEAARAFTGWSSNLVGEHIFRQGQHDFGSKIFLGKRGNFNGDDIIEILLENQACAHFITSKIYQFFVNEELDREIVHDLSKQFYESDYDIGLLMRSIFESEWFYQEENIGCLIKSPIDLIAGFMTQFGVVFEEGSTLAFLQRALGQELFNPPNVAGWPGGKSWINNATLTLRLNLVPGILKNIDEEFVARPDFDNQRPGERRRNLRAKSNLEPLRNVFEKNSFDESLDQISRWLAIKPVMLDSEMRQRIKASDKPERDIVSVICSHPEYQLC